MAGTSRERFAMRERMLFPTLPFHRQLHKDD